MEGKENLVRFVRKIGTALDRIRTDRFNDEPHKSNLEQSNPEWYRSEDYQKKK